MANLYVMVEIRKMYQIWKEKWDEKLWERGFGFFKSVVGRERKKDLGLLAR